MVSLCEEDSNLWRFRRTSILTICPICPDLRPFLWYRTNKLTERDSNPRRFRRTTSSTNLMPIYPDLRHFLWYQSNSRCNRIWTYCFNTLVCTWVLRSYRYSASQRWCWKLIRYFLRRLATNVFPYRFSTMQIYKKKLRNKNISQF